MSYAPTAPDTRVTGRRIVATLVDGIVLGALGGLLNTLFGTDTGQSGLDLTTLSTGGSIRLLAVVVLYYVLMEGLLGRTVGKMVTGIRVIDRDTGSRPGLLAVVIRTLGRVVDGLLGYLVGLIIVVNSEQRRRLGDMAAKTLVVRS